jgi:hypothetical protein
MGTSVQGGRLVSTEISPTATLTNVGLDWVEADAIVINGRTITPGTELSIKGERGRFRFIKLVTRAERDIEWIDVWGGPKHSPQLRSFRPDRIRTVHRINTTDKNLLKARKESEK